MRLCFFATTKSLIESWKLEPFKYEPELVNIPIMIVQSNGKTDKAICPFEETKANYDKIRNVKKVIRIRNRRL